MMSPTTPLQNKLFESSSCAKAILLGEHAVVYGARSIAIPLESMSLKLKGSLSQDQQHHRVSINNYDHSDSSQDLIEATVKLFEIDPSYKIQVEVESELPLGAGLGGSAALCVALCKAIFRSKGILVEPAKIAEYANQLEAIFHRKPSGVDVSVISYQQAIMFDIKNKIQPLAEIVAENLIIIDSGARMSTKVMVDRAACYFKSSQSDHLIESFDHLVGEYLLADKDKNLNKQGEIFNRCHGLLQSISVSTERLDLIQKKSNALGALGCKITGAGGGGCLIALVPKESHLEFKLKMMNTIEGIDIFSARKAN